MTPPETAAIKPEAKKVNAAAAQTRIAEEARAAGARIDQAERAQLDQARIDKWIRDRLVDWRESCWGCRKPIVVGQKWTFVGNGEVGARFHEPCHAQWLTEREIAARTALGLDRRHTETKP